MAGVLVLPELGRFSAYLSAGGCGSSASGRWVGQGICGGDGAGHLAGGYCASMGDDWRVRVAFDEDDPPELPESGEQALVAALRSRLGDQVAVTSSDTEIFVYAPAAGSADEAAQVARQVLARHDVSASVRTEFWSSLKEEWRDVTDEPSADPAAERRAAGGGMAREGGFPVREGGGAGG